MVSLRRQLQWITRMLPPIHARGKWVSGEVCEKAVRQGESLKMSAAVSLHSLRFLSFLGLRLSHKNDGSEAGRQQVCRPWHRPLSSLRPTAPYCDICTTPRVRPSNLSGGPVAEVSAPPRLKFSYFLSFRHPGHLFSIFNYVATTTRVRGASMVVWLNKQESEPAQASETRPSGG